MDGYGPEHLGELARYQLDAMRRDPRLERTDPAVVAEFYDSLWEIHHYRMLTVGGAYRLQQEVESVQGERDKTTKLTGFVAPDLQAAWERAQLAQAAIDTDFPMVNAIGVAQHVFALDALIEELTPSIQEVLIESAIRERMKRVSEQNPELRTKVEEVHGTGVWGQVLEAALMAHLEDAPWPGRPSGIGVARYEKLLQAAGMWPLPDLPKDLEQAVAEAHTIRNVVVHRAGFVDQRAIGNCSTFPFPSGELLRLTGDDYRCYTAAVRTIAAVVFPVADVDLSHWRDDYILGS